MWLVDLLLGMGHSNRCSQWVRSVKCQSVAWSCQWYHSCHTGQYKYYSSNGYTHGQVKRLETWSQDMLLISTCISMGMNVSICMRCLVFNDHLSFNITSILILHFYVDRFLSQLLLTHQNPWSNENSTNFSHFWILKSRFERSAMVSSVSGVSFGGGGEHWSSESWS